MIIDCHAHLVPQNLLTDILSKRAEFPSVRLIEEGGSVGFSFAGGAATRPVAKGLCATDERLEWMDRNAITHQVVGGWLDMFGYELPIAEGIAWARMINAHLAVAQQSNPRFVPLATVPLQDGVAAAEVLTEARREGFAGVMIGTQPRGVGSVLDDPGLNPFWEAADRTGAVVFIHPVFDSGDHRVHDYGLANGLGRVTDTLIAVSRLLYAGHPLRYGNARIVVAVGGAGLPFVLGRLKRNASLDAKLADPEAGLKALWYDTVLHDARALRFTADVVGVDRLMLGSDRPFPIGDPAPRRILELAGFSTAERAMIETTTPKMLFRL